LVDQREAALTFARIRELQRDPVQGQFDVAHLREVHRRIFQDLPHHGPGEFRPDAPGHFKNRVLEATNQRIVVPYALRPETDQLLGPTLDALQGGKALRGFDLLEMSEALAATYERLDYLHPFREGNSRTLRSFTEQLARENGHDLDWGTTNVTPASRDALYVARDMAVIQRRYPGLTAEKMMTVESRQEYEMAFQLNTYRLHDPLQEIIRRSLERGRDQEPYDRRMTLAEAVREIVAVGPVAASQAERLAEGARLAVLRQKAPAADHDRAADLREWVIREGNMAALSERLEQVAGGQITVRYDPGAPALERLSAIADGIGREMSRERGIAPADPERGMRDIDR
jgi:cell filamentation protein